MKFTIDAAHKIDVVTKSKVAYGPSADGNECVVVMECFLHDLLWDNLNRMGESKHP